MWLFLNWNHGFCQGFSELSVCFGMGSLTQALVYELLLLIVPQLPEQSKICTAWMLRCICIRQLLQMCHLRVQRALLDWDPKNVKYFGHTSSLGWGSLEMLVEGVIYRLRPLTWTGTTGTIKHLSMNLSNSFYYYNNLTIHDNDYYFINIYSLIAGFLIVMVAKRLNKTAKIRFLKYIYLFIYFSPCLLKKKQKVEKIWTIQNMLSVKCKCDRAKSSRGLCCISWESGSFSFFIIYFFVIVQSSK